MRTLKRQLTAMFKPARKRDTTEATAAQRARTMAETLGVTLDTSESRRGDTAIWIIGEAAARIDGERFCTSWSEAAEKLEYLIVSPEN